MIKKLHDIGLRSEHAYTAAVASIGLSVFTWATSLRAETGKGLDRADRWGIFIGEWAPTFFCLGLALSHYEQEDGSLMGKAHTDGERQRHMAGAP
ncbi:hypothetical protein [Streptomyces sp. NPDC094472]|uniref:hypothetical protein n=1 Tax=Streptomyces sp. NPDC094472 TaxID=3155080 RepID=UPI00331FA872